MSKLLDAAGIACEVRNAEFFISDLWICNEADYDRARSLIQAEVTSKMSDAALVWNRACRQEPSRGLREGDRALRDLLRAHITIVSGLGMTSAHEDLSAEQLAAAAAGYRYFGLEEIAELIGSSANSNEDELDEAGDRYDSIIYTDGVLVECFEAKFRSDPYAFAPVQR